MNNEQRQLIKKYLDIALRRKTILVMCLIFGVAGGLMYYLKMPKIYECTALLKYQRQNINPTAMSPDDQRSRTQDVVETVSQQIMSRSSLEGLVKEFDLYPAMRSAVPMENIVDIMRDAHIKTNLLRNGDVFQVSYQGVHPNKVMKVTNALAAKFIEENQRVRKERVERTSTYVKDELRMAKDSLDKKELVMRDYKLQYYNEMPDQLTNNTNRLNALQEQYQNNQTSTLEMERTRLLVQEQIAQRQALLAQLSSLAIADNSSNSGAGDLNTLQQVQIRLQQLQSRYTDKHPEIKRLKKMLAEMENQHGTASQNTTAANNAKTVSELDPQITEMKQQLKDLEFNIRQLNSERLQLDKQIKKYENWINSAPIREAEWSALTRDYDQLHEHYQRLVTQSLQADSAQTLENQLRGSRFKIVDMAHYPEKPFKPSLKKIMLMAIALGIGFGCVLSLGIELLDTSFRDPLELEDDLGVPVVCAIPALHTRKEKNKRKMKAIIVNSILIAAMVATVAAFVYFWNLGKIIV